MSRTLKKRNWVTTHERKNDKLGLIKIKNSSSMKVIVKSMKQTRHSWEKTLARYISDKGLIFEIDKEHLKINNKKIRSQTKKKTKTKTTS